LLATGFLLMQVAAANGTLSGNETSLATFTAIENALKAQDTTLDNALRTPSMPATRTLPTPRTRTRSTVAVRNGHPFELSVGNDTIRGGTERDLMVGDFATIQSPTRLSPTNDSREVTERHEELRHIAFRAGHSVVPLGWRRQTDERGSHPDWRSRCPGHQCRRLGARWRVDYWWIDTKLTDKRHTQKQAASAYTLYSDTIYGDDGDDLISADLATSKPVLSTTTARD